MQGQAAQGQCLYPRRLSFIFCDPMTGEIEQADTRITFPDVPRTREFLRRVVEHYNELAEQDPDVTLCLAILEHWCDYECPRFDPGERPDET